MNTPKLPAGLRWYPSCTASSAYQGARWPAAGREVQYSGVIGVVEGYTWECNERVVCVLEGTGPDYGKWFPAPGHITAQNALGDLPEFDSWEEAVLYAQIVGTLEKKK